MVCRSVWVASVLIGTFAAAQRPQLARAAAPASATAPTEPSTTTPSTTAPSTTPPSVPITEGPTDANGWPTDATTSAGADEVTLQSGGFVRGTIVELEPGTRVVILVDGTGERREIAWDKIAEVQRAKHATTSTKPATPPKVEPPLLLPARGRPRIHLELTRDKPVTLYEVNSEIVASGYNTSLYGINFGSVCAAPCDVVVDGTRGQQFFLGTGDGAMWTASRKFTLNQQEGDTTIRVKPGNRGMRLAGAILLGVGIGFGISGPLLFLLESTRPAAIGMLAVAVPSLGAGIPMMVLGRTRYEMGARDPQDEP